jgi:hypothetical protein
MSVEELEAFLESRGIAWSALNPKDRYSFVQEWIDVFGNAFDNGMRYRQGYKATYELQQVHGNNFTLFSFNHELPFWRTSENRPKWAYSCQATAIPDLEPFCNLDFAMAATDLSWTMVYTHEDFVLYGPLFTKREWIVAPRRDAEPRRRRGGIFKRK